MKTIYLLCSIILFFSSCSNEYTPPPQQKENVPVVLGEAVQNEYFKITLTNARNRTYPENKSVVSIKEVSLWDSSNNFLDKLAAQGNNKRKSNQKAEAGKSYILKFKYDNEEITAKTTIPSSFTANIHRKTQLSNDSLLVELSIKNNASSTDDSFYVIECWASINKKQTKLPFANNDSFIHNNKYGMLSSPFKRLFFSSTSPQQLSIKFLSNIYLYFKDGDSLIIKIKSVNPDYYKYLYNTEIQLQNEEFYLPNNANGYLGVWGGAYEETLTIF
ncbi:uncharacterized protein DUF4249 [Balneicella halophila]|uniref:Uncharacterized protein DUF4249 n=1 Tax=Balneicella halophila TaxID=1537566 RepID=A0A7L4UND6_BALHA|nr:DUF4249 family protein [Balneicella halophila]PVX49985.1 uncharacterized protein DUF4249 [Balneicella halophila]